MHNAATTINHHSTPQHTNAHVRTGVQTACMHTQQTSHHSLTSMIAMFRGLWSPCPHTVHMGRTAPYSEQLTLPATPVSGCDQWHLTPVHPPSPQRSAGATAGSVAGSCPCGQVPRGDRRGLWACHGQPTRVEVGAHSRGQLGKVRRCQAGREAQRATLALGLLPAWQLAGVDGRESLKALAVELRQLLPVWRRLLRPAGSCRVRHSGPAGAPRWGPPRGR